MPARDHRHIRQAWIRRQNFLDLLRVNADAAAFDHVLLASGNVHVPFAVEKTDISGVAPAAAEKLFGGFRVAIVSLDRHRAAQTNLPELARRNFPAIIIQNLYQHRPDSLPNGVAMSRTIFG